MSSVAQMRSQLYFQFFRNSEDAQAIRIDDDLAVILREGADIGIGQNIQHGLRRSAQLRPERRDDDWSVDEDGMGHHEIDQLVVGPLRVAETKLGVGRALLA